MNSATNYVGTSPYQQQTTRRSPFGNTTQTPASLTNFDMHYDDFSTNYTYPSSNNPSFFSPPADTSCVSSHEPVSSLQFPLDTPQCPVDLHTRMQLYNTIFGTHPSSNNPSFFSPPANNRCGSSHDPMSSLPQCPVDLRMRMRLWADLQSQLPTVFGTPSPASSSSSQMVITPTSLHDEGRAATIEDTIQYRGTPMGTEFDGSTSEYVNPLGCPSLMAGLDSNSFMKSSLHPQPSAAMSHSTWQFGGASEPCPNPVSSTQNEYAFFEDSQPQANVQRCAPLYHNNNLTYDPSTSARALAPSYVSSPTLISQQSTSQSSLFPDPLSSTSRFSQKSSQLHSPQPKRLIPIIPLSDLASSVSEDFSIPSNTGHCPPHLYQAQAGSTYRDAETSGSHSSTDLLPPMSLLCQPVSDTVRYQARPFSNTNTHPTTSGAFSPTSAGDNPDLGYYSNGLPKMLGSFFCVCGCLGTKHHV